MLNESRVFLQLVLNDFKSRFSGSVLGALWGFINPVITIAIYWFVFQSGLRAGNRPDGTSYTIWLICGMIPWFLFSDVVSSATGAFHEYSYLVKKVSFRKGLLPFLKTCSALIMHFVFLLILVAIILIYRVPFRLANLQIIYYLSCNIFFAASIGLFTSTLNVFLRDVGNIVGVFTQIGFWLTPIVWGSENVSATVQVIMKLNPLYYIVEGYRDSYLTGVLFITKPLQTVYFWIVAISMFCLGYYCFRRLKNNFADLL